MLYTYHLVALRDATPQTAVAFADHVAGPARDGIRDAGGELLGLFLPQLGFASHERIVLIRWSAEAAEVLGACPSVASVATDRLAATARPSATARPTGGGIYVHRWFTIDPADQEQFVALSTAAWKDFEIEFDSQIFGLFAADPVAEDGASMRMLLLTRYGGHSDWEVSRRPSAEPGDRFRRRHALTRLTRGCSTVLAPLS